MDSLRGLSGGQCFDGKFVNDIRPSNLDQLPCEYRRQTPRLCKSIDVMMEPMVHVRKLRRSLACRQEMVQPVNSLCVQ